MEVNDLDKRLDEAITRSFSVWQSGGNETTKDSPNGMQWFRPNGGELWFFAFDKEAVTQAFKDAGWAPSDVTQRANKLLQDMANMHANMQSDMLRLSLASTPVKHIADFSKGKLSRMMTGQEWYEKFEKALPEPYHTGRELSPYGQETSEQKHASLGEKHMHHEAIYAAKKAAGIE